jgi:hypothetical protein
MTKYSKKRVQNKQIVTVRSVKKDVIKKLIVPHEVEFGIPGDSDFLKGAKFYPGLTGSLTKLTDGRSYIAAGDGVTITSASNGQITISSTGGGGGGAASSFFTNPSDAYLNATGSLSLAGNLGSSHVPDTVGTDVFLFVSGTIGSKDSSVSGTAVFGGDLFVSGSTVLLAGLSGSLTHLSDGRSYIKHGAGIKVASKSNDSIEITTDRELVFNEKVGGNINGVNTRFTLANTPFSGSQISLFVNGQLQTPPDIATFQDFSITGSHIYFTTGSAPEIGSVVLAIYNKAV